MSMRKKQVELWLMLQQLEACGYQVKYTSHQTRDRLLPLFYIACNHLAIITGRDFDYLVQCMFETLYRIQAGVKLRPKTIKSRWAEDVGRREAYAREHGIQDKLVVPAVEAVLEQAKVEHVVGTEDEVPEECKAPFRVPEGWEPADTKKQRELLRLRTQIGWQKRHKSHHK